MKKKSCSWRTASVSDPHHGLPKFTEEQVKHPLGSSSAGPRAAKNKSWKSYLTCLSKFQNKMKRKKPDAKATNGTRQKNPKRGLLLSIPILEECSNLARVIRRTAADCFAAVTTATSPSSGADEGDLPYMQLDQVTYRVKTEAFGPVYLVT